MSLRKLRFAIFGNIYQARKSADIQRLLLSLNERMAQVSMERSFYDFLCSSHGLPLHGVTVFEGNDFDADFVISMGGDGTLLRSAYSVGSRSIPIIGVNMGRLGFLAGVGVDDFDSVLDSIYADSYMVDSLAMVKVESDGANGDERISECALNEIAILTGSTAYSLSNGGPIIVPHTGILCLTPVAPHSLNMRPIVVADDSVITLEVESRSHNYLVAADGRSIKCGEGQTLTIRRSPYDAHIVKPKDSTYFSTLRAKMMWGADMRMKNE